MGIQDQFLSAPRLFDLKKVARLCTPVDKNGEGIKNPDRHLLCYKALAVPRQPLQPQPTGVQVSDQFGERTVNVKKVAEFCVTSDTTVLGLSYSTASDVGDGAESDDE